MRWRMRTAMVLVLLAGLAVAVWGSVASATTSSVRSEPNGDVRVTVSVGSLTDRDRDGDFNTATKNDVASLFYAVTNQSAVTQRVHVQYALDGPGTELDRTFSQEVVLEPNGTQQDREEFKITQRTPVGEYALTITAAGTETATARATFVANR
jgi:hypothetical protein